MADFKFIERNINSPDGKREIEVTRNGRPYGLLWTWPSTDEEWHPWHAMPLHGSHHTYLTLEKAKDAMTKN